MSIFQDGGRGRWILFPVSNLLMSLPIEGQSLSANQILSTYLNWRLRYNYFRFGKKTNVCHLNSTFGFDFGYSTAIGMLFCIMLPNFIQIGPSTAEIWRHIHFSKWWPRLLNTTSGFVFLDVTTFRRAKFISKPIFCRHISIRCWDITTSGF